MHIKEDQDLSAEEGQANYNLDRDGKEKETLEKYRMGENVK